MKNDIINDKCTCQTQRQHEAACFCLYLWHERRLHSAKVFQQSPSSLNCDKYHLYNQNCTFSAVIDCVNVFWHLVNGKWH